MLEPELPAGVAGFNFPTRVRFGVGAVKELASALAEAGVKKPLVVTDGGLVATAAYGHTIAALGDLPHAVYSGVEPNPLAGQADEGAALYASEGCDGVIGLGGGSALDVAKVVRVLANHGGKALDYDWATGGTERITSDMPFCVTIPTTAGTGSEVGRSSVITDPVTKTKRSVFSAFLMPSLVLADPELTRGLPSVVTANTGLDALTHATEAYLTPGYHPMADAIALAAVAMVGGALPRAVADGDDMAARTAMMMAAMMGATAFQKGLGATHALAHPLSTLAGMAHGRANGLLLPHVLRFNAEAVPGRVEQIGLALSGNEDAAAAVEALAREVGLPKNLTEAGVDRDALFEPLVEQALGEYLLSENPRKVTRADIEALYDVAFTYGG